VHLPSLMWRSTREIEHAAVPVHEAIRAARRIAVNAGALEVVAGDFNMAPYADVLVLPSPGGFGANRCLPWTSRRKKSAEAEHVPLYNPTWSLLAAEEPPQGSYYSARDLGPWYVFDQVLMSPEMAPSKTPRVMVASTAGGTALHSPKPVCKPLESVGSDHFPVIAHLAMP
jgi:hypothetical protein